DELRRHRIHLEAERVADLPHGDDDGDAGREPHRHRVGDVADEGAEAGQPHRHEEPPRHERGDGEPVVSELLDDRVDEDDEGARGPADLDPAPAEGRDEEAGDDGGVEPLLRRDAGGDGEGDGERERDDADDEAGGEVPPELGAAVPLPEHGHELGFGRVQRGGEQPQHAARRPGRNVGAGGAGRQGATTDRARRRRLFTRCSSAGRRRGRVASLQVGHRVSPPYTLGLKANGEGGILPRPSSAIPGAYAGSTMSDSTPPDGWQAAAESLRPGSAPRSWTRCRRCSWTWGRSARCGGGGAPAAAARRCPRSARWSGPTRRGCGRSWTDTRRSTARRCPRPACVRGSRPPGSSPPCSRWAPSDSSVTGASAGAPPAPVTAARIFG